MGIDLLDIRFRVERTLGVQLETNDFLHTDAEGNLRGPTAGELADRITAKLERHAPPGLPLRDVLRQRIDRVLADFAGARVVAIDGDTPLDELLPAIVRREAWQVLQSRLGVPLPALRRAACVRTAVGAGVAWTCLCLLHGMIESFTATTWGAALAGMAASGRALAATAHAGVELPRGYRTLDELTDSLLRIQFGALAGTLQGWHREEVWEVLRSILAETLGIPSDSIQRDSRLVEDLGAE